MVFFLPAHMVTMTVLDALVRPVLFLAAGLALATWVGSRAPGGRVLEGVLPQALLAVMRTGVKTAGASVLGLIGVTAVVIAGLVLLSFGTLVTLYEALQPGVWGIITLSIAQLALLPTAIIWGALWMVGPGFAVGTGALVSPLGTTVQAVPALPLLGIIPSSPPAGAIMIVAVPLAVSFVAGVAATTMLLGRTPGKLWRDVGDTEFHHQPLVQVLAASAVAGLLGSVGGFVLASITSGAAGPGRFQNVGADPAQIALWWGLEIFVGVVLGLLSGALGRRSQKLAR
jgi:cytochrome c oxidase assembly factor CtaG